MDLALRGVLVGTVLSTLAGSIARAQLIDEIPHASYYIAAEAFYAGEYRDAERSLRRETQRGIRTTQARWIDSICYHALLGEVLYHQGRNADALAEFDQACQLLLAYPNWLLQVKFQQPPRPDPNRARRVPPWGRSERQFTLGQTPRTEQVLTGDLSAERAIREGGVFRTPMFWRVNVVEVIRTSALAIRRRNELLGPLAPHDPITKELSEVLGRGNLAPPNHWSRSWIDLLRGLAQAGLGKLEEADTLVGRALVIDGQFDYPLTCVVLLEQGRLAMVRGDHRRAAQLLAEAGFSAYYFENWDVLTESALLGWMNHLASGGAGVYPPLEPVAAWAQVNRLQHIATKLRLAHAESLLWLGQTDATATLLDDTSRRIDEMRNGLPAIHQLYVQAAVQLARGQIEPGSQTLAQALAAQAAASLRNFQIARTTEMFDSRAVSPRVAVDLYSALLADPTPADWVYQPLDVMAGMQTIHDAAFDRWFIAALERKEVPLALEIAERAKRRRFLASRPLGGRMLGLRAVLEAPEAELSREAVLQRQHLLVSFPAYRALSEAGQRLYDQLRAGPIIASDEAQRKPLAARFDDWAKNAEQRQLLLAQLALRRVPSVIEFPPLRTIDELKEALGKGEALVVFHSAAGNLYGFLLTQTGEHVWRLSDARRLRAGLGDFLRAIGNYGANRALSAAELQSDSWRESAADAFKILFADARLDLAQTTRLVIVPDGVLWYLPFEALLPSGMQETILADHVPIRYGPTAALAVAKQQPLRRPQHTGIVANEPIAGDADAGREEMLQELEKVVTGPLRLTSPLAEPSHLITALLDGLISFDSIAADREAGYGISLLPRNRGGPENLLQAWFALPIGGAETIVLTGFTTEAEQGLRSSRRSSKSAAARTRPGEELFQSLCGLMANGARTILLTRWCTGGRTNFELVREFVQELPHAPATEAWQRACLLAREAPLDATREPRFKRSDESGELPTADHPFFWAGYLLVDTSAQPHENENAEEQNAANDNAQNTVEAPADGTADKPGAKRRSRGPASEKSPTDQG